MPIRPPLPLHRRRAGQAVLEHIGIVVVVAILVGVTAVWAARELRPPDSPPAVIERVVQPLALPDTWFRWPSAPAPHRSIFWRTLRNARLIIRTSTETVVVFGRAFLLRVKDRALLAVTDPERFVTGYLDGIEGFLRDPVGSLGPDQIRRVIAYVREMRSLPPREALRRLAEDAGGAAADIAVDALTRMAARRILARLPGTRPPPAPPRPPTPPPAP